MLRIDGADIMGTEDDWGPFEVPGIELPGGTFVLEVVASDWAGNEAVSSAVTVHVGEPPAPEGSTDDDGGALDESSGDAGGSSDGEEPDAGTTTGLPESDTGGEATGDSAQADERDRSGCRVQPGSRSIWLLLLVPLAFGRHRRVVP